MITDNPQHPKTYEVTKLMDTFPLGVTRVILLQTHYNEHTDLCGVNEKFFRDKKVHMICDFYESNLRPYNPPKPTPSTTWKLSEVNERLYVNGQPQTIQAIPSEKTDTSCEWHIFVDGEDYTDKLEELYDYLNISIDESDHTFTIAAINKDLAKYIVSIKIYDKAKTYYDFVEMEVAI